MSKTIASQDHELPNYNQNSTVHIQHGMYPQGYQHSLLDKELHFSFPFIQREI